MISVYSSLSSGLQVEIKDNLAKLNLEVKKLPKMKNTPKITYLLPDYVETKEAYRALAQKFHPDSQ